jgi:long-chain acyl-CoA synthetase
MTLEVEGVRQPGAAKAGGAVDPFWLASYPPGIPTSIDPDRYPSLPAMLLDACARHAARPAFQCLGTRIAYAEWEHLSRAFAAFLIEEVKCRAGDRVAIMLPNLLAYPVAFLGALRADLVVVNVNPLYTPRELKNQLADSGAVAIVIMENFAHKLAAVIGETAVRHVVVARLGDFMPAPKRALLNVANTYLRRAVPSWRFDTFTPMHAACHRAPGKGYADAQPAPNDPALLQYTGGTTGVSKGAILSHRNLVANTLQCEAWISPNVEEERSSVLTPLPLYHIFSLTANLLAFAEMGGLSVLVPDPRDLKSLIKTMRKARVTTMTGVNTLFNALVNSADFATVDFSTLRFAIGGGAAVQSTVAARWRQLTGTALVEGYGLTESSPVVCINPVGNPRLGTVGLPVPSTEVAIRDDAGNDVPVGEAGEICVRGPQVMQGYWRRPDETKLVLGDGWLHTGDIGAFDAEGFLKILDRKKDMINVSGFKVFPNEVEDVVAQHPGVLEAAAIGVNDERSGQAVKLFVVKRDPALTAAELTQFAHERLAGYKVPKLIQFVDGLPKSNVGKIIRKDLR